MKSSEKGFTLLELCICFILFSIFLECIWGFFTHIYTNYYTFNRQVNLDNEANNVEVFIRDNIRAAYELKISVEGGIIEAEHTNAIDGKAFQKMEFKKKVRDGGTYVDKTCKIHLVNNTEPGRGKWKLVYEVNGTPKTISDLIETIKITSNAHSDLVTFECTLKKEGETNTRLQSAKTFSESIAYKEKYT